MLNYLPETVNQYATTTRASVSSLIRDMKVGKTELSFLIEKMRNTIVDRNFSAANIQSFSLISKEILIDSFRNLFLRLQQMFSAANANGLVLTSMVDIFSSEISKVEEDLNKLELFIDNYEFISGKDDMFNANYVEKFNSFVNDYRADNIILNIPDRDNAPFGENGNAYIDGVAGHLKMGNTQDVKNIIRNVKSINIKTNYDNYITTNNDFLNLFNDNFSDSWTVTAKSPSILDAQVREYLKYIKYDYTQIKGAITCVELELQRPIKIDTIRFNANDSNNFQLVQAVVFHGTPQQSNNMTPIENYTSILSRPVLLNNVFELRFSKNNVSKIIFIFNQSNYTRSNKTPLVSELNSKVLDSFFSQIINDRKNRFSKFQDIVYWFFVRKNTISGISRNKYTDNDYYTYRFPSEFSSYMSTLNEQIKEFNSLIIEDKNVYSNTPVFVNLMNTMLDSFSGKLNLFENKSYIENLNGVTKISSLNQPGFLQYGDSNNNAEYQNQFIEPVISNPNITPINSSLISESENSYEYSFSLKSIELIENLSEETSKAVFVSKKIPVDGQITSVKVKLNAIKNTAGINQAGLDLSSPASYEISVSNKSIPNLESDWVPIVPYGVSFIDSEVLFIDPMSRKAVLRFTANNDSVNIYKNGILIQRSVNNFTYSKNNKTITLSESLYDPSATYVASYGIDFSLSTPDEIDFIRTNIFLESIKAFNSENGPGESFTQTDENAYIRLSYNPYINPKSTATAVYGSVGGTNFIGNFAGYSPVKIQLSDGSYALNITNYTNSTQKVEFYQTNSTLFIHSGQGIVFNRNINSPFKVYYQYVPNDLRFRVILRKNIANSTDPISIDSLIMKMKTITYDPYYGKINSTLS